MATWTRQPQEQEGNYLFKGIFTLTIGVSKELSKTEIVGIYYDILKFLEEKGSIDYLQVFTDEQGRKLFLIDQLDKEMLESGNYLPEDNYCTLMFAHEY